MQHKRQHDIFGNWATLLLPVNKDNGIDWYALEEEIDLLIDAKSNGIYSNGTAGEFYNQTESEFDRIQLILSEKCLKKNIPFQIGCSHMSPVISLERIKRAKTLNPTAIQVILPDWFPPSTPEIKSFLDTVTGEAAPVRIVLYNPPHSKKFLLPEDYRKIIENKIPIAGCKTSGGNEQWYEEMNVLTSYISVFIPGHFMATGIRRGMHGTYSNVACLNPYVAQQWYNNAIQNADLALQLEKRIQTFIHACITPLITKHGLSNQGADKLMAAIGNWGPVSTRLRWPYQGAGHETVIRLREQASLIIPEFIQKTNP
ncbi:dihydrodipicolinate synthase family protein [Sinomicrobium soli]|uniref:dihydrodipicolinate synthase family protein n=1 Tax=Sinomicrobium sp. N-1-3-6 TaxID=2219864 RepID=UPI000DCCD512|nr:dihydrodipicolinate synthase family protein [Sinomicrobium sp. N-1-3-6]RAV29542.1 dihydrodipicolinate synthase family protein [Sinomicrobium sp. N-1-3-6]